MKETQLAWAAGIVDADGCITIKKKKVDGKRYYALMVIVAQSGHTKPAVTEKLQRLFGGNLDDKGYIQPNKKNRLPRWTWQLATKQAEIFLTYILPYLVGKADQARVALEYRQKGMGRGKRAVAKRYYEKLRSMKNYNQEHPKWQGSK